MKKAKPEVVARYIDSLGNWWLCHARSYQNAFGSAVNGFPTREAAQSFAESNGCVFTFHEFDQLQKGPAQ